MGRERKEAGFHGENEAVAFLRGNSYKILERNYKTPFGEIDIIAKKDGAIVFVEVKSGAFPLFGPPYLRVTRRKMRSIIKTALSYLKKHDLLEEEARVDVVSINFGKFGAERIELIENAVESEGWWL